ncbi:alpha-amylase family protein [Roseimarinus sediminis]|jgi:alpha-galactosidase|uniref:hypothetical protein n=1 Tax=Roseimarinus sediminis TaxID=1610899 RepID=UPI003D1F2C9C
MDSFREKIRSGIYFILGAFLLYGCGSSSYNDGSVAETISPNVALKMNQIEVEGDVQPFNKEIRIDTLAENLYLIHFTLYTDFPSSLPRFKFKLKYPRNMVDALWSSRTWSNLSYINIANYARLQSDYNVLSALASNYQNRITLASFDDFKSQYTQLDVQHAPDSLVFSFNFFNDAAPDVEILEYKATVLVDLQEVHYSESVRASAQWRLDNEEGKSPTNIESSLKPVYSLWYPMDQNIPLEGVTHYFDSISSLGFRSILFDDGWQNVVRFEVDQDGKWDPSKINSVKSFMDIARKSDMKVALWYSQPFLGAHNYVFKKFEGKYLQYRTSSQPLLDIRYPEVRQYLSDMYSSIVSEWDLSGIWFNFLNSYYPDENIIITEDLGRDFISVRKALDSLRSYMEVEMLEGQADLSINQSYRAVGPLVGSNTKTINGFLGTTVLSEVREKMVNNRLMYGDYSPFIEVMGIHPKDPAVDVARKFHSIMFATPYVSFFSYTLPDDVKQTLKFWIAYWDKNYEYLIESGFKADNPVQRYPVIDAGNEQKRIIVFYNRVRPYSLGEFEFADADLINSSDSDYISLSGNPPNKVDFISYDHKGTYFTRGSLRFKNGVASIEIPQGGYARLIVD